MAIKRFQVLINYLKFCNTDVSVILNLKALNLNLLEINNPEIFLIIKIIYCGFINH